MNINKRRAGRIIRKATRHSARAGVLARKVARLDRAWRIAGRGEGRLANDLGWRLGQLARDVPGGYEAGRRIQILVAAQLGQLSGWEQYYS